MFVMNRKIIFLLLLLLPVSLLALSAEPVLINGKWERDGDDVSLYKIVSGRLVPLSTYHLEKDNPAFGFNFVPDGEGFYAIGNSSPLAKTNKFIFYFKPGDELNLWVNDSTYTLIGENTPENVAMTDWYNWLYPMQYMAVYFNKVFNKTYVDFFPLLDIAVANPYTPLNTNNEFFNEAFARFREYDLLTTAFQFLQTPRSAHPHEDEYPDFYRNLDVSKLTRDDALAHYPYGAQLLVNLFYFKARLKEIDPSITTADALDMIKNDTLKGEYLLHQAKNVKTYVGYRELIDPFAKYIITPDQMDRSKEIVAKLAKESTAGDMGIDFTHKDINGKDISLSDFKGKVVLVDVWATWCGPCKGEIPALKEMEKQYKGRDVVFLSVSVDEEKDLQKWKDFIKAEKLGGVQLFAGGWESDIVKFYEIKGIPRFMLFDKKGRVVSKDAPRPSSDELKILIDAELNK